MGRKAKDGRLNRLQPADVAVGVRYDESDGDVSSSVMIDGEIKCGHTCQVSHC